MLTPDKNDASWLDPNAYIRRPIMVSFKNRYVTITTNARIITIVGLPNITVVDKIGIGSLKLMILPPAISSAAPLKTPIVPNVIITGAHRDFAMIMPFIPPHTKPHNIPHSKAPASGIPELTSDAITQLINETSEPIERSNPPDINTRAIAIAHMPVTEICLNRFEILRADMKRGLTNVTTVLRTIIISAKNTICECVLPICMIFDFMLLIK